MAEAEQIPPEVLPERDFREVDRTWVNPTTDDPGDDFDVELYLDFEVEAFADGDESGDFSTKGGSHAHSAAATMPFRADEMDLDFAELDAALAAEAAAHLENAAKDVEHGARRASTSARKGLFRRRS